MSPLPALLMLVMAGLAGGGCTAVPQPEFAAYRQAFAEARQASTPVINDLGLTWHEAAQILGDDEPQPGDPLQRPFRNHADEALSIDEQVMVRHQLWIVVERYNDALAAIAEGKTSEQAEGAVNGFLDSLERLPIRRLTELAAAGQPLAGLIGEGLRLISREVRARQFREAVVVGGPIVEAILIAMQEEIDDLYDLRLGVSSARRDDLEIALILPDGARATFETLYAMTGPHPKKDELLGKINNALRSGFWLEDDELLIAEDDPDASPPNADQLAQLITLAAHIKDDAALAASINEEIRAYRETLLSYAELLRIVQQRMNDLREVVDDGPTVAVGDVLDAAMTLHWQFTRYRDARAKR